MGYVVTTSNPSEAMRLAQHFVNTKLDWADIEAIMLEVIKYPDEHNQLYQAVSSDYLEKEKRRDEIWQQAKQLGDDIRELFLEYSDLTSDRQNTREIAWFQLGYATALRLTGHIPKPEPVDGGNT